MTPEEKAKELVEKFSNYSEEVVYPKLSTLREFKNHPTIENAKECASTCVDEIENALIECGELSDQLQNMDRELNFWQNVRKAIEML